MKKTNFFYASALMMACAFGIQSCTVEDNPTGSYDPAKTVYTYDFAAAADGGYGSLFKNYNGNQNNGQAFPWWRNADDPDRERNEWKGYQYKNAGDIFALPEVCHVWTSNNFRMGDNIKNGGVVLGSDCGIAIDGLKAGSTVKISYIAPLYSKKVSLEEAPFQAWDGWVNANPTGNGYGAFVLNESTGLPYGDGNVNNYADLSEYTKLIVTVTEGAPRFLFNRDVTEGQWSENEAESHLIDNTKGGWSAKYFSSSEKDGVTTWTVDLAQMVADKGYAHLHAIKGANWANCTVTGMTLETKAIYSDSMIWAVGDGSKNNGGTPLSAALVDGVAAVSGETVVASGATIEVLSVAPYKKSSGHIVINGKKGMILTKVTIDDAEY